MPRKNCSTMKVIYSYYDYDRDGGDCDSVFRTFVANDDNSYNIQANHMRDKFEYVGECEKYKRRPMIEFNDNAFCITNAVAIERELSSSRFDSPMYSVTIKTIIDENDA